MNSKTAVPRVDDGTSADQIQKLRSLLNGHTNGRRPALVLTLSTMLDARQIVCEWELFGRRERALAARVKRNEMRQMLDLVREQVSRNMLEMFMDRMTYLRWLEGNGSSPVLFCSVKFSKGRVSPGTLGLSSRLRSERVRRIPSNE